MKLYDLTHPISPAMPVFPGMEPPEIEPTSSVQECGYLEHKMTMFTHTGTHMDAPAHIIGGAKTLGQLPIDQFFGSAFLLALNPPDKRSIEMEMLSPHQKTIQKVDFLLLDTGWAKHWGTPQYFSGYPVLSLEAAAWLGSRKLKGVGMDMISADDIDSRTLPVHRVLLENECVIIENLTNLESLPGDRFDFSCFPIKLMNADGSPVRAVAFAR